MATYDLIGVPFPKDAPIFASDRRLQEKLSKLESFIEMHHDIHEIESYIAIAGKIQEEVLQCQQGAILSYNVRDALSVAAIVLYAKLFKSSQGRTKLNKLDIFPDTTAHDFFMDVRDKFLAHQEWNANKHQVFFFQESKNSRLRMNPFGQTTRIPIWPNLDWERLNNCTCQVGEYLKTSINCICKSIQDSFRTEQVVFLNTISPDELFQSHWREQPNLQKSPF
jgi:hypothetical protein